MKALRTIVCFAVLVGSLLGISSSASAQPLVGFHVYPDMRGLRISSFIPGTSAEELHRQGELYPGDIITRYDGRHVFSAQDVIRISSMHRPGAWLRMEFLTPEGIPFWHWVRPGGGMHYAGEPLRLVTNHEHLSQIAKVRLHTAQRHRRHR